MIIIVHISLRGEFMKTMMKMMAFLGGGGILGYMYLKKHPEKMEMMRELGKEASRKMYNKFDTE